MYVCPHCEKPTISFWRKIHATDVFPLQCPNCSEWSHISILFQLLNSLAIQIFFVVAIMVAINFECWICLLLFPICVFASSWLICEISTLQPTNILATRASRMRVIWQTLLVIATITTLVMVFRD